MLSFLRSIFERFPELACYYRTIRDTRNFQKQRPKPTPYGFNFMGNPEMVTGTFEPEQTKLIRKLLKDTEVFVDIGANIGFYTCIAQSAGRYTIACEPLRENLDFLYANLEANGWHNVEVYPIGLAEQPGLALLYGSGTGASLLKGWAGTSPLHHRPIPLSTLDILLNNRFKNGILVKVDVEGAEYRLLNGAIKTLAMSNAPTWIIEITITEHHPNGLNPNFINTFEIFWQYGYQAFTANDELRLILPVDVVRWFKLKKCEYGSHNFLFAKRISNNLVTKSV